jgi:hypothetical protein
VCNVHASTASICSTGRSRSQYGCPGSKKLTSLTATGLSIADLDELPRGGRNLLGPARHSDTDCTGEITYTGHGVLPTDMANFCTAFAAAAGEHGPMPNLVWSPS